MFYFALKLSLFVLQIEEQQNNAGIFDEYALGNRHLLFNYS